MSVCERFTHATAESDYEECGAFHTPRRNGQAGGDLDAITFGAHENHVILKPRAANVGTNFVVYTNRRAYRFDYTVADRRPDRLNDEVIYAVRFIYPPPPAGKTERIASCKRIMKEVTLIG